MSVLYSTVGKHSFMDASSYRYGDIASREVERNSTIVEMKLDNFPTQI